MNTGLKIKATIFIVLFLVLVAMVIYLMDGFRSDDRVPGPVRTAAQQNQQQVQTAYAAPEPTQAQQVQTYATQAPVYATPDIYIVPAPTEAPVPTPMPTPVPTPEPTPVPQPVGMPLGNGTFTSNSGSLLNIHADWNATVESDATALVNVTVYADHWALFNSGSRALFITLGDQEKGVDTADIAYEGSARMSTVLGAASFSVPLARGEMLSFPLRVVWNFGGMYGDGYGNKVDVSHIDCDGTLTLSR